VAAKSEDAIKAEVLNDITPLPGTAGFKTVLRSLPTDFLTEWSAKRGDARRHRDRLCHQIVSTTQAGRPHECLLTAGQTAGGISGILPVSEIIRKLIAEAEAALTKMQSRGEPAPPSRPKLMADTHSSPSLAALQEVPEPDSLGG
jgi:NAD(P)H-dependent flavin oxidoreductase YrpB (nitropropane dioxygenase family)